MAGERERERERERDGMDGGIKWCVYIVYMCILCVWFSVYAWTSVHAMYS